MVRKCSIIGRVILPFAIATALAPTGLAQSNNEEKVTAASTQPRRPFPQHVSYVARTIRPMLRTQQQQDGDVRTFYEHWKATYLREAGTSTDGSPLYRVSFGRTDPGRTVSEGQGYGMMIVAWMAGHDPDARAIFDGLWKFSRAYPSSNDSRLMNWEVPVVPDRRGSAFDGDCDIAYALLLADAQWPGAGYRDDAKIVLDGILSSTIGPQSHLPTLGDWVLFDAEPYNQYTPRSSDLMIDHFRAFASASHDPRWTEAVRASQSVITSIQTNESPVTGLLPDFIVGADRIPQPAPPGFLEGPHDGDYYYNAGRDPWRIGFDALTSGDSMSFAQAHKISRWAATETGGDPLLFRAGYSLYGTSLAGSDYFTSFFVAPLGPAAMTDPDAQRWLDAIYDAVRSRYEDYYEDSVTLLSMLVMSGNAWPPSSNEGHRRLVRRP